ncbi:MAG: type IV pilus assembly protein PilM [Desulfobacterales bacterium]|nr:type IV pilus assembly protein PilM [Desulfobacterales bacterium]
MLFGKKYNLVGLDIGSCTFKVGEIVDSKKGRSLKNFSMLDIPPGVIEEGTIREPDIAAQKIHELFKTAGIKEQNVAISIGGFSIIVKNITVQTMTEAELQETIQLEAEQYIPFDISDVNLDFQIIGENENNPNQMNVILVAAKKEMVEDYLNVVQLAGLNPLILDVDAFALQNIFELNYEGEEESIALIDIGASKTSLNILKGSFSVFMRDVSLGCSQINQKIMSLANCSAEDAEDIKFNEKTDKISKDDLSEITSAVVSDWCAEIRRALDFFYSTYPDEQIKRVILSGGGANIKEFQELLAVETSTEVETIDPFKNLIIDNKKLDASYLEQIAPQAAICMGLAIRRADDK